MYDTFVNPNNYLENRATVGKYLGSACFDYPLMAAGGMLGSAAAQYGARGLSAMTNKFRAESGTTNDALLKLPENALLKTGDKLPGQNTSLKEALDSLRNDPKFGKPLTDYGIPVTPETRALANSLQNLSPSARAEFIKARTSDLANADASKISPAAESQAKGWKEADMLKVDSRKLIDSLSNNPALKPGQIVHSLTDVAGMNNAIKTGATEQAAAMMGAERSASGLNNINNVPPKFELPKFNINPESYILNPPKFDVSKIMTISAESSTRVIPIIPLPLSDYEVLHLRKAEK